MNFQNELSGVQLEAVNATEGPSLVIAGAGSGKTRVLTYRIAQLLANGVPPEQIMALTFTNKAAEEMKQRIGKLVGEGRARALWMGTFHSIFSRILRKEADLLGYTPQFTIYDTSNSLSVIRGIIKEMQLDDKVYKAGEIHARISSAKNNLILADQYAASPQCFAADKASRKERTGDIYTEYNNRLRRSNAMDFDDLLVQTALLFTGHQDVLKRYQTLFTHFLVDEYQDTNYVQYLIIRALASQTGNLCVVGDDSQSIYSFRGARVENILQFRSDYPSYKLFKLERNYRSTETIVTAANSVIDHNSERIPKKLYSENGKGDKIKVVKTLSDKDEASYIAGEIARQAQTEQLSYREFAVLYRNNSQSRLLEEALRQRNIPYLLRGGFSFYQREEIVNLIAYFRISINPDDDECFKRVFGYPKRGLGATSLDRLQAFASFNHSSLWTALNHIDLIAAQFNKGTLARLLEFKEMLSACIAVVQSKDALEACRDICALSGMNRDLSENQTPEGIARKENVEELVNAIREFCEEADVNETSAALSDFVAQVSLRTDADNEKEEDREKVTLMTIHSAKGLEYRNLFIVGVEEDLFPSAQSAFSPKQLEEERRLFYVAITRAKRRLAITYTGTRFHNGEMRFPNPSRFIREIDATCVERSGEGARSKPDYSGFPGYGGRTEFYPRREKSNTQPFSYSQREKSVTTPIATPRPGAAIPKAVPDADIPTMNRDALTPIYPDAVKPDMLVYHEKFEEGKVLSVEGAGPDKKAKVRFKKFGEKTLMLKYAKLFIP